MTSSESQRERAIVASLGRPFSFQQGSSLHIGLLGMVLRPSSPHDQEPYIAGTSNAGFSQCLVDLTQIHADPNHGDMLADSTQKAPPVALWFDEQRIVLDISAAFDGAPAEALEGAGIPSEVLRGPVSVDKGGDAGDGVATLLTQMCIGKLVVDPAALLALIGSDAVTSFAESASDEYLPLRAFNAVIPASDFLTAVGLTSNAVINQIAVLGYNLRSEAGPASVTDFESHLDSLTVDVAWFIDEQDRVQTAQAVMQLTEFFGELFRSEPVLEQMAREEQCSPAEVLEFVEETAAKGRVVYVNAIWQTFHYDAEIAPVELPATPDITAAVAAQAARMREQPMRDSADGMAAADEEAAQLPENVTIDADMLEQMRLSSGAMHFVLRDVDGDARAAMVAAQRAVGSIRHPDEPSEALASFMSEVVVTTDGAQFWADISDMAEEPVILERILTAAAAAAGANIVAGHLSSAP